MRRYRNNRVLFVVFFSALFYSGILHLEASPPTAKPDISRHLKLGFDPVQANAAPFGMKDGQPYWPVLDYTSYFEKHRSTTTKADPDEKQRASFLGVSETDTPDFTINPRYHKMLHSDPSSKLRSLRHIPIGSQPVKLPSLVKSEMDESSVVFFGDIECHAEAYSHGDMKIPFLIVKKWQYIAKLHPDEIEEITGKIAGYHGFNNFVSYINSEVAKHKSRL